MANIGIILVVFLTAMGIFQIYTALNGGLIAYGIITARKYL